MAKTIQVFNQLGGEYVAPLPVSLPVKAGGSGATIQPGYLVIKDGSNAGYVKAAADACDSDSIIVGVANAASTETASVDGTVSVTSAPSLLVRMKAKTPGSLVASMKISKYILDVTSGNYTLDQGTTTKGILTLLDFDNTTDGNCVVAIDCNL